MTAPAFLPGIGRAGVGTGDLEPDAPPPTGITGDAGPTPPTPARAATEKQGYLLDEDDEAKVCRHVEVKLWKAQDKRLKKLDAQWTANEYTRRGVPGARVVEDPDTGITKTYVPIGATGQKVGMPKADQLIRKVSATLLVDPPLPEATPSNGEDAERAAAELSTRILRDEASESGVNLRADLWATSNFGGTYGSGFTWVTLDPQGGGWQAMEVQAAQGATHYDDANPDAVTIDPATGEGADAYVKMYVMPDGTLSPRALGARKVWRPALRHRRLTGRHVRLLPETATGIADATGVVICQLQTLGELRADFVERFATLSPDDEAALVTWRPAPLAKILPPGVELDGDGKARKPDGDGYADEALCMTLTTYYRSHGAYPMGAYVVVGGGRVVLHKGAQSAVVGAGDEARDECLDIPVAQCRQLDDPTGGNAYGIALAEKLASGDDIRATQLAAWIEYLWRFNRPNLFLPLGSVVQPGALAKRNGTPIYVNPEGKPEYEQVPAFPREATELYTAMGEEMNSEAGLEESAQGVDTDTAVSGVAKQLVVEQALTALAGIKQNTEDYFTRLCRIDLQYYRAYFSTPQLLKFAGADGGYRLREWTQADLRSTKDVRIARGSFTMLSRSAKQALARDELNTAISTQQPDVIAAAWAKYQQTQQGTVDPILGLEDDPHRQRIKRQVSEWMEGAEDAAQSPLPPAPAAPGAMPGAMSSTTQGNGAAPVEPPQAPPAAGVPAGMPGPGNPAPPPGAPPTGQPPVDPATGQPLPPPSDPRAAAILAPLDVDVEPTVAKVRHEELARVMAGSRYQVAPPAWRTPFAAEYQRMRQAAGVATVAEQQAAQQQAQAQQAQMAQTESATKMQLQGAQQQHQTALAQRDQVQASHEAATDRAHQTHEADKDRLVDLASTAAQQRVAMESAAAQGTPGLTPAGR